MSQPYVGEIRMFAGNFAPVGWNFCDGSLQPISENETLFNLIGTTYGGDGQETYGLPDLRGRVPIHQGNSGNGNFVIGQMSGTETVTLNLTQLPAHTHAWQATTTAAGNLSAAPGNVPALSTVKHYKAGVGTANMAATMVANVGGSQPHDNMMPFVAVSFIISMFGIFPSQT